MFPKSAVNPMGIGYTRSITSKIAETMCKKSD